MRIGEERTVVFQSMVVNNKKSNSQIIKRVREGRDMGESKY